MTGTPIQRLDNPIVHGDMKGGTNGPFGIAVMNSGDSTVSVADVRVYSGAVILATVQAAARTVSSITHAIEVDSIVDGVGFVFVTSSGLASPRTTNIGYGIFSRL